MVQRHADSIPSFEKPVPLEYDAISLGYDGLGPWMRGAGALLVHDNGRRLVGHCESVCGGPLRKRRWLEWEEGSAKVSTFRGRPRCFKVGGRSWPVPNQGDARRDGGGFAEPHPQRNRLRHRRRYPALVVLRKQTAQQLPPRTPPANLSSLSPCSSRTQISFVRVIPKRMAYAKETENTNFLCGCLSSP